MYVCILYVVVCGGGGGGGGGGVVWWWWYVCIVCLYCMLYVFCMWCVTKKLFIISLLSPPHSSSFAAIAATAFAAVAYCY